MSVESMLAKCGMTAADVRSALRRNTGTMAQRNEARYNPKGEDDSAADRYGDAERMATAMCEANFGQVYGSDWQARTRIGG